MIENKPKGDLLGLAPFGDAVKIVAEKAAQSAQEFFNAVCMPASTEVGFLLRDKVRAWRAANLEKIAGKAQDFLSISSEGVQVFAHPRIALEIVENGSKTDDDYMQNKWAGLLASACTPDGKDESNLVFIELLNQLASSQVKLLDHVCKKSKKGLYENGLVFAEMLGATFEDLKSITGVEDVYRLDREFQHLRWLGLVAENGLILDFQKPTQRRLEQITPERLTLQFFVRSQGSRQTPRDYFSVTEVKRTTPYPEKI